MRVLVTGGAGFMGSHIARELCELDHEVHIIDDLSGGFDSNVPDEAAASYFDLRDTKKTEEVFKRFAPDICYHLACHPHEGLSQFMPCDIASSVLDVSLSVFRASVNCGSVKRIIHFSTMARYGDAGGRLPPFLETDPCTPKDVYGAAKLASEHCLRAIAETHGIKWCILAPHNVSGPGQNLSDPYRNVISIWANRLLKKKAPIIYGDGQQRRAMSDIRDSLPAYLQVGGLDGEEELRTDSNVINIGGNEHHSIVELAMMVLEEFGSDLKPVFVDERPREVALAYSSHEKANTMLGFEPVYTTRETIISIMDWARSVGPQECIYLEPSEIEIKNKLPKVWKDEEI